MSSSRSVAAARARRAGGNDSTRILKPSQTRNTAQKSGVPPSNVNNMNSHGEAGVYENKLSISDAFALVTIRLGRVETILQKLDITEIANKLDTGDENSNGTLNNVLIKTISSRIDDLENSLKDSISVQEHNDMVAELKSANSSLKEELLDVKNSVFNTDVIRTAIDLK